MALPPLPQKTGNDRADIEALYLYLQRTRDGFPDSVAVEVTGATYSDEQAQDAIGAILHDTATVDLSYDDALPTISADVKANSSTQKVEVAKDSSLVATRKRLNFLEKAYSQLGIADDAANDQVLLSIAPYISRFVATSKT